MTSESCLDIDGGQRKGRSKKEGGFKSKGRKFKMIWTTWKPAPRGWDVAHTESLIRLVMLMVVEKKKIKYGLNFFWNSWNVSDCTVLYLIYIFIILSKWVIFITWHCYAVELNCLLIYCSSLSHSKASESPRWQSNAWLSGQRNERVWLH